MVAQLGHQSLNTNRIEKNKLLSYVRLCMQCVDVNTDIPMITKLHVDSIILKNIILFMSEKTLRSLFRCLASAKGVGTCELLY